MADSTYREEVIGRRTVDWERGAGSAGISLASAASTARSAHDSLGALTCRWRTAT
jgi:hypothetical protein